LKLEKKSVYAVFFLYVGGQTKHYIFPVKETRYKHMNKKRIIILIVCVKKICYNSINDFCLQNYNFYQKLRKLCS